jgi:membrane-associated phospholipid phosphatase
LTRPGGLLARLHQLDLELFERTAKWHNPLLDRVLPPLSSAADHSKLWVVAAGVLAAAGGREGRRAAARGLGAIAITSPVANLAGKLLVSRVRPSIDVVPVARRAWRVPTSASFPSGHSASAAAFTTGVALELPGAAVPIGVMAAGVAYSRVYTGVHYPGDVVAGIALGTAIALLTRRVKR